MQNASARRPKCPTDRLSAVEDVGKGRDVVHHLNGW